MVAELTENIAGWERINSALDEIRACHEETLTFFSGALDQLGSLYESLLSREQQIEKQTAVGRDNTLASDAADNNHWNLLLKEFKEDRAELHDAQQSVQQQIVHLTSVADDLATARNEFQTVRGELARHNEELTAVRSQTLGASKEVEASIRNNICDMEQQQSLLEKERAALETELESVRSRAAEMAELLAGQKSSIDDQRNQWAEELRQMRTLLESLTGQIADSTRQSDSAPAVKPPSGVAAVALNDPVLESVLAQFEILQQDRFLRRSETMECVKKNNE